MFLECRYFFFEPYRVADFDIGALLYVMAGKERYGDSDEQYDDGNAFAPGKEPQSLSFVYTHRLFIGDGGRRGISEKSISER